MSVCMLATVVMLCVPEGQVLQFGPDFLPVEPDGVLLPNTLCCIETGSHKACNISIQKPSQELTQDLCPIRKLAGWKTA